MAEDRELTGYEAERAAKDAALRDFAETVDKNTEGDSPVEVPEPVDFPAPPEGDEGRVVNDPDEDADERHAGEDNY